jgi:hypothetical protein
LHPPLPHEMTVTCQVTPLTIRDGELEPALCRDCQARLNTHQPDEDRPEHLLGTCPECGKWYLIEFSKSGSDAFLIDLIDFALIRATLVSARPKSSRKRTPKRATDAL